MAGGEAGGRSEGGRAMIEFLIFVALGFCTGFVLAPLVW